jgi:hypothetical protein
MPKRRCDARAGWLTWSQPTVKLSGTTNKVGAGRSLVQGTKSLCAVATAVSKKNARWWHWRRVLLWCSVAEMGEGGKAMEEKVGGREWRSERQNDQGCQASRGLCCSSRLVGTASGEAGEVYRGE